MFVMNYLVSSLGKYMFFSNLHFSVDLSVDFEGLKRSDDNVIIVGTYEQR